MKLFVVLITAIFLVDLFAPSDAFFWRRRRRRRRHCYTPSVHAAEWSNNWDQSFTFACPRGKAITGFYSLYSSCHRDRVFRFYCRRNKATRRRCHWSHYVNDFDGVVSFKCPNSGFITGVKSYHSNHHEDRRFMFRCCHSHYYHPYRCTHGSHYVNGWRQAINFRTPWKYFLVGATSYHDNGQEDRRWKFEYCQVARNTPSWYRARKTKG